MLVKIICQKLLHKLFMHVDQAYKPTTVGRFDSELFQPLIRYKYSYLYT